MQELSALSLAQIHTLRACSLLAIPPPPERVPPQGGFLTDLSELNLSGWATLVQDVVAGLQALPPNLGHDMGLPAEALLQLLEASTGVGFCHYCCSLSPWCKCMGASQPVPPASWSQIVEQTPGYGVITSSGGMTTPSTSVAGMPGYVAPPLGLTPPDFSSWSLPPPEAPLPWGLPAALQSLPDVGRSIQIRAATERHTRAQLAQGPRGLAQQAQTQPTSVLHIPQMALPLHQPPPGQLATPYQQAVQLPGKSTGRGVTFDHSIGKTSPAGGQSSEDCGRQRTRGQGMMADLPVTPGCKRKQVGSCLVRRMISPLGQHQTFPQPQHLKVPHLSWAVGQGLCPMIPHNWLPNTIARDGKRTLSMCSRSTTGITPPPIRRQSG